MATQLAVSGKTSLQWSLSDAHELQSFSATSVRRVSQAIANGSGLNQANVAVSFPYTVAAPATGVVAAAGVPFENLGITLNANITTLREMLVTVASGPTGSYAKVEVTTGVSGIKGVSVGIGGMLHWSDYLSTADCSTADFRFQAVGTGVLHLDVTLIGLGSYYPTN